MKNNEVQINIITPKISDKHNDSFWYHNKTIAVLECGPYAVEVIVQGVIKVIFEENGMTYTSEDAIQYALDHNMNDSHLDKVSEFDGWLHSNWFTIEINGLPNDSLIENTYDDAIKLAEKVLTQISNCEYLNQ